MVRFSPTFYDSAGWIPHSMIQVVTDETSRLSVNHIQLQIPRICGKIYPAHSLGIFYGENPIHSSFSLILLEIIFVILTTWLLRVLLKPLKQPRVISEIIGGIIIGPSILGRNRKFAETIFPDNAMFLVRNIGVMGLMFFIFIAGVKVDLTLIKRSGKNHVCIALSGVILPIVTVTVVALLLRKSMDEPLAKMTSIGAISSSIATTTLPVLAPVLKELNLLSSEVGRMAVSAAIIGDIIGMTSIIAFEAGKQGEVNGWNVLWFFISLIGLMAFFFLGIRRLMVWIVDKTPEGQPVSQGYIVGILLGVMVMGFLTDMFGMAIANGPLWLGLMIPVGPPLGATLVERTQMIITEFLMPFTFALVGLYTDVFAMTEIGWSSLSPIFALILTGYVSKIVGTFIPCLFFDIPTKDSLTLSLIMSLRGQVELMLYIHWMDKLIIGPPHFTLLVLSIILITGIAGPLINVLYDPTRPYMVNKRRTIQHHPPATELRLVVCIHDQESVAGLINLLEVSYPTVTSPFSIYALRLIELVGRGVPLFVDYDHESKYIGHDSIHSALTHYSETRGEIKFHPFTAVAPMRSMYQDICELALDHKASLIVLPYHKEYPVNLEGIQILRRGVHSVNLQVLSHAPCSVGILVDKGTLRNPIAASDSSLRRHPIHHFVVLFLGGADARETLAYADRMTDNKDISLTVIRFLAHNHEGDDETEKKLDDGVVTCFWVKNEANERVRYREVVVRNGAETVAAIQAVNDDAYCDLWIVGRSQGVNQNLIEGLTDWSEDNELGVVGDYVASADFGSTASVLVIQQQVLRRQGPAKVGFLAKLKSSTVFSQFL